MSSVDGSHVAALNDSKEDPTGFEDLVASLQGGSSKNASLSKLHSLTGGTNRSLFFTEASAHKIPPESLKTAAISLLTAVRPNLVVPVRFIESMHILNELVLLFLKYFKVVFRAFPSLFVGLEEKLDKALGVASLVYGHPRSFVLLCELHAQFTADIASMRVLPYMMQEIAKITDSSGALNGGGSAYVAKVYNCYLNSKSSL